MLPAQILSELEADEKRIRAMRKYFSLMEGAVVDLRKLDRITYEKGARMGTHPQKDTQNRNP